MLKGFHLIISITTITVLTVKCLQSVDTVKPLGTAGLKVSDFRTGRICDWIFGCAPKNSCVIAPVRCKTQSTVRLTYFQLYLRTRTRKTVYV